jgi:hypothetical protein
MLRAEWFSETKLLQINNKTTKNPEFQDSIYWRERNRIKRIKFDGGGLQQGSVLREQKGVPPGRRFRRFGRTKLISHLGYDTEESFAYNSTAMCLRDTGQAGNFVRKWATVNFSWWPLLREVDWLVGQSLSTMAGRQGKGMDDKTATGQFLARASHFFLPRLPRQSPDSHTETQPA